MINQIYCAQCGKRLPDTMLVGMSCMMCVLIGPSKIGITYAEAKAYQEVHASKRGPSTESGSNGTTPDQSSRTGQEEQTGEASEGLQEGGQVTQFWKARGIKPEPQMPDENGFSLTEFLRGLRRTWHLSHNKTEKEELQEGGQ